MLNFIRRVTSWRSAQPDRDEDCGRPARGPIAQMLACDIQNLNRLTQALAAPRR